MDRNDWENKLVQVCMINNTTISHTHTGIYPQIRFKDCAGFRTKSNDSFIQFSCFTLLPRKDTHPLSNCSSASDSSSIWSVVYRPAQKDRAKNCAICIDRHWTLKRQHNWKTQIIKPTTKQKHPQGLKQIHALKLEHFHCPTKSLKILHGLSKARTQAQIIWHGNQRKHSSNLSLLKNIQANYLNVENSQSQTLLTWWQVDLQYYWTTIHILIHTVHIHTIINSVYCEQF